MHSRYEVVDIKHLFSEVEKRKRWRFVWLCLATAQSPDLVSAEALHFINLFVDAVDLEAAMQEESRTHHDLVSELRVFQRQVGEFGRFLHLGATSSDIVEAGHYLLLQRATEIIGLRVELLGDKLADLAEWADEIDIIGMTHFQEADTTTLGHRFSYYRNELQHCWSDLGDVGKAQLTTKGFRGTVGTGSSYSRVYQEAGMVEDVADVTAILMDRQACNLAGLRPAQFSLQTPHRHSEYLLMACLCSIGAALHKLSVDFRLMSGQGFLQLQRPSSHVGSSSMDWKNNPVEAEQVCSLTRLLPGCLDALWHNRANSWLERSLDDSANSRVFWYDAFTIVAYCLDKTNEYLSDTAINRHNIAADLMNARR